MNEGEGEVEEVVVVVVVVVVEKSHLDCCDYYYVVDFAVVDFVFDIVEMVEPKDGRWC